MGARAVAAIVVAGTLMSVGGCHREAAGHLRAFSSERELRLLLDHWQETGPPFETTRGNGAGCDGCPPIIAATTYFWTIPPGSRGGAPSDPMSQVPNTTVASRVGVVGDRVLVLSHGVLTSLPMPIQGAPQHGRKGRQPSALDLVLEADLHECFGPLEFVVYGNTVAVIGEDCDDKDNTLVSIIDVGSDGRPMRRASFQLRTGGFFTTPPFESHLVGSKLVLYAPFSAPSYSALWDRRAPAMRQAASGEGDTPYRQLLPASRVYDVPRDMNPHTTGAEFHALWICDLARREFTCDVTAVLAPPGPWDAFAIAADALYAWTGSTTEDSHELSMVLRMPLDGTAPTAVEVAGSPAAWAPVEGNGIAAVLDVNDASACPGDAGLDCGAFVRLESRDFGDGHDTVSLATYHALPSRDGAPVRGWATPRHLVVTADRSDSIRPAPHRLVFVDVVTGTATAVDVPHPVADVLSLGHEVIAVDEQRRHATLTPIDLADATPVKRPLTVQRGLAAWDVPHWIMPTADSAAGPVLAVAVSEDVTPLLPADQPVEERYQRRWDLFRPVADGLVSLGRVPAAADHLGTRTCLGNAVVTVGSLLFASADCHAAFVDVAAVLAGARASSQEPPQ